MSQLRLVFLNQYFPPDTAATARVAAQLARRLALRHRVTVVAGRPSYDPTERHPWSLFSREVRGQLVIERVGSTTLRRHGFLGRLLNYLTYLALAAPRAAFVPTDAVIGMTDPPVLGIMGALLARIRHRPFIYCVQDLYPDLVSALGLRIPRPFLRVWERVHRWALHSAARVLVLGEDMQARIVTKGVDPTRISVVRTGAPVPASLPTNDHLIIGQIRDVSSFVVMHAGNLGFYGAWDTLLTAAASLRDDDVHFVFIGDGAEGGRLRRLAASIPSVRFLPYRPAQELPYVLAAADLHVVTVRQGLEGLVVPSKLYGILAAGRPVLVVASEHSDAAKIVRRYGCGLVADPDNPQSVVKAIKVARGDPAGLLEMAARARIAGQDFDEARQLEEFSAIVEESVMNAIRSGGRDWTAEAPR